MSLSPLEENSFSHDDEMLSYYLDENEEDEDLLDDDVGDCTSFRDIGFQSEEMKYLLKLEAPPTKEKIIRPDYHAEHLFPQWILSNHEWQTTTHRGKGNKISEILQTSFALRTQEQTSALIHWLMSVWKTAFSMGFKRCGQMSKVFQFLAFEPGQDIIVEGEKGSTFYIIISGDAIVLKNGLGQVAKLYKGHSFGELALTEANDKRSATIRAETKVEVLQLHKVDYDHFVKDIQLVEKRENLHVLRRCQLFENWPRTKVQKLCNFCSRKLYKQDDIIFSQGDLPDKIYFIIEGQVDIFKEIYVVVRNRWPTGMNSWDGMSRKKVKPFLAETLNRDDYFGELSIVHDKLRTATAKAKTACTLLALDRLDFINVISNGKTVEHMQQNVYHNDYTNDKKILETMLQELTIKGGPSTTAQLNDYVKVLNVKGKKTKRISRVSELKDPSGVIGIEQKEHLPLDHPSHGSDEQSKESKETSEEFDEDGASRDLSVPRSEGITMSPPPLLKRDGSSRKIVRQKSSIKIKENSKLSSIVSHNEDEHDDDLDSAKSLSESATKNSFIVGMTVVNHKATEFHIPTDKSTGPEVFVPGKRVPLTRSSSSRKFEDRLSRATHAVLDTTKRLESLFHDGAAPPISDGHTNHSHDAFENSQPQNQNRQHAKDSKEVSTHSHHSDKQPQQKRSLSILSVKAKDIESHLKLLVGEIVSSKQKMKYYDKIADMRINRVEMRQQQGIDAINLQSGQSLKFKSKPNAASNQPLATVTDKKIVYSSTNTLAPLNRNPHVHISDEKITPIMTTINSVVLKSEKGRRIRSSFVDDINSYVDSASSSSSSRKLLPALSSHSF